MKSKFIFLGLFLIYLQSAGQDNWRWNWVEKVPDRGEAWLKDMQVDHSDYIYCMYLYNDSIFFPDTAFIHPTINIYDENIAIAKYDPKGKFIKALDIYSLDGKFYEERMLLDANENIYIAVGYRDAFFVQDTMITPGQTPYVTSDICLMKFNQDFKLKWAKLTYGRAQDNLRDIFITPDNHIYTTTEYHSSNDTNTINYFGQDTVRNKNTVGSISKLDLSGLLVWHKDFITPGSYIHFYNTIMATQYDTIYCFGSSTGNLFVDEDTLIKPPGTSWHPAPLYAKISMNDDYYSARFIDNHLYIRDIAITSERDFYISSRVFDTLFLGQDTIVNPEYQTTTLIGKINQNLHPYWYDIFTTSPNQLYMQPYLTTKDDSLIFTVVGSKDFSVFGHDFSVGMIATTVFGLLDPDGNLIQLANTESAGGVRAREIEVDNCGNFLLSGIFSYKAFFGEDTLIANTANNDNYFISEHMRFEHPLLNVGPDTVACDSLYLTAPGGYIYYQWDDKITNSPYHTFFETGMHYLSVTDEGGCFAEDSVFISIISTPQINLTPDTSIHLSDTLILSLPANYNYLWSTGDTSNQITLTGEQIGIGTSKLWVKASDSICSNTDTLLINVVDDSGIDHDDFDEIYVFPNPSGDFFHIYGMKPHYDLQLFNVWGERIEVYKANKNPDYILDMSEYASGVYILSIITANANVSLKLIKK